MAFPKLDLENLFTYHAPKADQPALYEAIRNAAKEFAKVVVANTPDGPDQTIAIRHIQDAVMRANLSIATTGFTRIRRAVKEGAE
jgi:hypothetical protein